MAHVAHRASQGTKQNNVVRVFKKHSANLSFVLFAVATLGMMGAIGLALVSIPSVGASGIGTGIGPSRMPSVVTKPTCGSAGLPSCPQQVTWITVRSLAASDLIAAARQSPLFRVDRSGNGDYLKDISLLGAPVFVRALQARSGAILPDFYVIPILDHSGAAVGAAELELNAKHSAIHVIAIVTYTTPHPGGVIARLPMQTAISDLETQRHVAMRAGFAPELVYYPIDAVAQQTGKIVWVSGGEFPADPIWLIAGTDGQEHVVGVDGHVYLTSELP